MSSPRHDWLVFLVLTMALSLVAGLGAFAVGGERTFDSPRALPLLLLTIWAPNLVAVGMAHRQGTLGALLGSLTRWGTPEAWVLALLPLAIAATLVLRGDTSLGEVPWLPLIALNLAMGPLGEELGWRGFLLPRLVPSLGWVGAALAVGVVWALWHLPLWFLPSPHRSIPFWVFAATVVCFSVLLTAAWRAGDGALGPIIAFHLAANVAVGALEVGGVLSGADFYRSALPVYAFGALMAAAWLGATTRGACAVPALEHPGSRVSGSEVHRSPAVRPASGRPLERCIQAAESSPA